MSQIIPCPIPGFDGRNSDGTYTYYVATPDEWLGEHSIRYDKAAQRVKDRGYSDTVLAFSISLELVDDFHLPDLTGKLTDENEADKLLKMRLDIMAWVNTAVHASYMDCFNVKKKYLTWLSNLMKEAKTMNPDGG